ncbi:MAG: hypothetical protein EA380_10780 [Phycisphaeraceae bacterium]|nr:MAG: hypothetical protein EA380_10780 [Phycisphaeraceae bacterium]
MHELAVLSGILSSDDPDTLIISLVSTKDELAELVIVMPEGWRDSPNPLMPLDMRMQIGRFGHPDRERRFLADLRERLETIAASPTASAPLPIR